MRIVTFGVVSGVSVCHRSVFVIGLTRAYIVTFSVVFGVRVYTYGDLFS